MSERRRFNISALSELFVLLAIVFLTQTIVNVALEEDAVAIPQRPVTQVVLNQFPSGGDTSDHLRYISVGSTALVFVDGSACDSGSFLGGKPASREIRSGCLNLPEEPSRLLDATTDDPGNLDLFSREVFRDYGVRVRILREKGKLTKISMVFDPKQSREPLPIHIGMCICHLPGEESDEAIPASWNLDQKHFRTPHPLVVQVITYKGAVRRETALFYSHEVDFQADVGERSRPIATATERYAFNSPDCAPTGTELRQDYIRDVEFTWPSLAKGVSSEL